MGLKEARQASVVEEAQEDRARVARHHHEGIEPPHPSFHLARAEVSPIDLGLLPGKGAQHKEGLRRLARTQSEIGNPMAKMILTAWVAASAHHLVHHTRRQLGMALEGLPYKRDEGIEHGPTPSRASRAQPLPLQDPTHGGVMDAQFKVDGPPRPAFDLGEASNLGCEEHRSTRSGGVGLVAGAESRAADRALRPRAIVMRHFLSLALSIRLLTTRMKASAAPRLLVPLASFPHAPTTRRIPTRIAAVAMAPIAPRAQIHRSTTQVAEKTAAVGTTILHTRLPQPGLRHPPSGNLDSLGRIPQASRRGRSCHSQRRPRRTSPFSLHSSAHRAHARDDDAEQRS